MTPATIVKFNGETYLTMYGLTIATNQILAVHIGGVSGNPAIRTFSGTDIPVTTEQAEEVNRAMRASILKGLPSAEVEVPKSHHPFTLEDAIRRFAPHMMVDVAGAGFAFRDYLKAAHGLNLRGLRKTPVGWLEVDAAF